MHRRDMGPEDESKMMMAIGHKDHGEAWDDVTGEKLEWEGVQKARHEEIQEIYKRKVYRKVPLNDCWDKTGKAPIKVRWLDINKGDSVNPELRSTSTQARD